MANGWVRRLAKITGYVILGLLVFAAIALLTESKVQGSCCSERLFRRPCCARRISVNAAFCRPVFL
jgi:hypothetical protein